jgi:hypothetical protein|nr:MAG TPA: hypothetical protein [Bacteriophage sp.]
MIDKVKEYGEQARNDGKEILKRYANGIDYLFIKENDGWYSIIDISDDGYRALIQAQTLEHAESYINMRERINVPFTVL